MLSKLSESVTELRVGQARLEAATDEYRRWIDAHRQRTTASENTSNARFEQLSSRVDGLDRRSIDHGHHLKAVMHNVGVHAERLRALESPRGVRGLEIWAPVALVAAAIAYKVLVGGDISSLMQR